MLGWLGFQTKSRGSSEYFWKVEGPHQAIIRLKTISASSRNSLGLLEPFESRNIGLFFSAELSFFYSQLPHIIEASWLFIRWWAVVDSFIHLHPFILSPIDFHYWSVYLEKNWGRAVEYSLLKAYSHSDQKMLRISFQLGIFFLIFLCYWLPTMRLTSSQARSLLAGFTSMLIYGSVYTYGTLIPYLTSYIYRSGNFHLTQEITPSQLLVWHSYRLSTSSLSTWECPSATSLNFSLLTEKPPSCRLLEFLWPYFCLPLAIPFGSTCFCMG